MKRSLRQILSESHIAAIMIAILLFWFFDSIFQALLPFIYDAASFVFTAIAIVDIPYISKFGISGPLMLEYLYSAGICILVAHTLSHWVYRLGPFAVLVSYWSKLVRRKNVQEI